MKISVLKKPISYVMSSRPCTVDLHTVNHKSKSLGTICYVGSRCSMQANISKGNITFSSHKVHLQPNVDKKSTQKYLNCGGPLISVEVRF